MGERRGRGGKNILNREPKRAEEKEEIVVNKFLKGERDVFFCNYYSSAAKACRGDAAESVKGGGAEVLGLLTYGILTVRAK